MLSQPCSFARKIELEVEPILVALELYSWQLTNGSAFTLLGSFANDTDPYAGGRADLPVSPNVFYDYVFQTKMSVPSPAVQVDSTGNLGVGTTSATDTLDVNGSMRLRASRSPASTDPCQPGEIAWDSGSVYVCVAQDTWRRSALVTY